MVVLTVGTELTVGIDDSRTSGAGLSGRDGASGSCVSVISSGGGEAGGGEDGRVAVDPAVDIGCGWAAVSASGAISVAAGGAVDS